MVFVHGDTGFDAEELIAYELGYRVHMREWLALDLAAFYNDYDQLRSEEPSRTATGLPLVLRNKLSGETYGAELAATAQIIDGWRLRGSYTVFEKHLRLDPGSRDPTRGVI
jgi:iron complex outermembrane receptor protein